MKVTFEYFGQLRMIAGEKQEEREFPDGSTMVEIIRQVAEGYGADFANIVLDENGDIRPSVMLVVNDETMDARTTVPLQDGQRVKLISAIAGG